MTTTPGDEIAYRTTPGGELWHPTGTPQDEATAVASDSIHRQLGASVEALADATEATLTELGRQWTISHIARAPGGRLVFAPGTGTIPVRRTSTGRLAVGR